MQWQHDVQGQETGLHCILTKDGAEVDFAGRAPFAAQSLDVGTNGMQLDLP